MKFKKAFIGLLIIGFLILSALFFPWFHYYALLKKEVKQEKKERIEDKKVSKSKRLSFLTDMKI